MSRMHGLRAARQRSAHAIRGTRRVGAIALVAALGSGGLGFASSHEGVTYLLVTSFECTVPDCLYENAVLRYDGATGAFAGVHISDIDGPFGMAINPQTGRLLLVSRAQAEITEHDARTGDYLRTLVPAGSGGMHRPRNMAFTPQGTLLVTSTPDSGTPNAVNGILEFDPDTGQFLGVFVDGGTLNPIFPEDCGDPHCIRGANSMAYGPDGDLYVTSFVNHLVLKFDGVTGVYQNFYSAPRVVSPNGIAIRKGTLRPGNILVTSLWDDPNSETDFQKVIELDVNQPGPQSVPAFISSLPSPGPLLFYNDGSPTCSSSQTPCLMIGIRRSSLSPFNNDLIQMHRGDTGGLLKNFTADAEGDPFPADTNLHVPTAMLPISFGFASCDFDGDGDVDLKDHAMYQACTSNGPPSSACLTAFDDDLTGTLSDLDSQVCLSRITGPPFTCTADAQCNDGNPCTMDSCSDGTCQHAIVTDGTPCPDDVFCDGEEVCRGGVCSGAVPCIDNAHCDEVNDRCRPCVVDSECDDGNVCTADTCDLDLGCQHAAVSGPCEDGDACTVDDFCSGGVCQTGTPRNCDDSNVCTDDSCDPAIGCRHVHNLRPCDDNSVCTINDACLLGVCRGGETINCDDGIFCTVDFCDSFVGCQHTNRIGECNDQDPCTTDDVCTGGVCVGVPSDCDDGIECTIDECVDSECAHTPDDTFCDNGVFCDGAEICDPKLGCVSAGDPCAGGGECQDTCVEDTDSCNSPAGTPCSGDSNVCTTDVCDGSGTCGVPNSNLCDDGDACTIDDACSGGACIGVPLVCDDEDKCTEDSCDPAIGCVNDPIAGCECLLTNEPCTDDVECCSENCRGNGTCQ